MKESLFSPNWYRIANLKPRLRRHARIHRHTYSGELWFVLENKTTGQSYRFTPIVFHVIGLMDGQRTIQELWDAAMERFGDDAPTQGDMINILSQLYSADVLVSDVTPDMEDLLVRHDKQSRLKRLTNLRTPLALRFPLLDPERFLNATVGIVRPIFSVAGAIVWLMVVLAAMVTAVRYWPELTGNLADRILSAQNLAVLWIVYPAVKVLHELGHGYAVKRWGGEVHEMGIMLLVLMPIPYVDASSATAFPEKRRRILVSSAGMMVELFLAAVALLLWVNLDQGLARSVAFNVVVIGSISTILFNGNPLLRYDGYYIFLDAVEIPNLAQRSLNYLAWIIKRYLFGIKHLESPQAGPGERFWLVTYSIAAFIYRLFIYTSIILFISGKFFFVGIILALWAFASMFIMPVAKRIQFLAASPLLRHSRTRAVAVTAVALLIAGTLLFVVPAPHRTRAEGIVWIPKQAMVRAGTDGFIERIEATPDAQVEKGDVLIVCSDPLLSANVKILQARVAGLKNRYDSERYFDRVKARITLEELDTVRADLARSRERLAELEIRSNGKGKFVLPGAADLPGRYIRKGDLVAFVLNIERPVVRAVVPQADVDLIRQSDRGVQVRLAENLDRIYDAEVVREIPGAVERLPSTVLGVAGGGEIAMDPRDAGGLTSLESMFQLDIKLKQPVSGVNVGGRVYILFDHGVKPMAYQWYRDIRRLFIKRFHV
jgi:putative peptide zinc metalloprotease protein